MCVCAWCAGEGHTTSIICTQPRRISAIGVAERVARCVRACVRGGDEAAPAPALPALTHSSHRPPTAEWMDGCMSDTTHTQRAGRGDWGDGGLPDPVGEARLDGTWGPDQAPLLHHRWVGGCCDRRGRSSVSVLSSPSLPRVLVMTTWTQQRQTGILLRRLQLNPTLQGVSHVILDEVHERCVVGRSVGLFGRSVVGGKRGVEGIPWHGSTQDLSHSLTHLPACLLPPPPV